MESTILKDSVRIRALGIFPTFEEGGGEIHWNSQKCAFKFLVIDGRLVIGAIGDHSELYAAYRSWDEVPSDENKVRVSAIAKEQWAARNYSVSAAGAIGVDGQITGWRSECFRVETPSQVRDAIEQEVSQLFRTGALTPR